MNLTYHFIRSVNANLAAMSHTSPRKGKKISKLFHSQAKRWLALQPIERVQQIFAIYSHSISDEKFDEIQSNLISWAKTVMAARKSGLN